MKEKWQLQNKTRGTKCSKWLYSSVVQPAKECEALGPGGLEGEAVGGDGQALVQAEQGLQYDTDHLRKNQSACTNL